MPELAQRSNRRQRFDEVAARIAARAQIRPEPGKPTRVESEAPGTSADRGVFVEMVPWNSIGWYDRLRLRLCKLRLVLLDEDLFELSLARRESVVFKCKSTLIFAGNEASHISPTLWQRPSKKPTDTPRRGAQLARHNARAARNAAWRNSVVFDVQPTLRSVAEQCFRHVDGASEREGQPQADAVASCVPKPLPPELLLQPTLESIFGTMDPSSSNAKPHKLRLHLCKLLPPWLNEALLSLPPTELWSVVSFQRSTLPSMANKPGQIQPTLLQHRHQRPTNNNRQVAELDRHNTHYVFEVTSQESVVLGRQPTLRSAEQWFHQANDGSQHEDVFSAYAAIPSASCVAAHTIRREGAGSHESVASARPPTLLLVAPEVAIRLRRTTPERCFSQPDDACERETDFVAHAVFEDASRSLLSARPGKPTLVESATSLDRAVFAEKACSSSNAGPREPRLYKLQAIFLNEATLGLSLAAYNASVVSIKRSTLPSAANKIGQFQPTLLQRPFKTKADAHKHGAWLELSNSEIVFNTTLNESVVLREQPTLLPAAVYIPEQANDTSEHEEDCSAYAATPSASCGAAPAICREGSQ